MQACTRIVASFLLIALCTAVRSGQATTMVPVDADELVDAAGLIFTGTAVHHEVVLSQDGRFPFTFVTFRVEETFKGRVQHQELTLRFHGGRVGDEAVVVLGTPEFAPGERYLLFVADNGTSRFPVVGWRQGQYRFDREPRSGASVLVDDQGRALGGIERGRWHRAALPAPEALHAPAAVLLDAEGVEISEAAGVAPDGPRAVPAATEALAALRRHVGSRAAQPTFVPGRLVRSARPEDVPASVEWALRPAQ